MNKPNEAQMKIAVTSRVIKTSVPALVGTVTRISNQNRDWMTVKWDDGSSPEVVHRSNLGLK